ncbi:MAG: ABC transporter permease [Saprospiraceae bacterium]|nr:ABC transporter permease [Saprospiraceae bacterium]
MNILIFLRVMLESILQAFQQLLSNKLRTFLSLLGITIGIWCIIMVFAAVGSLEASIKSSMQELGNDVVYVTTMPWGEDPREDFWKYMRRPDPSYKDFEAIKRKVKASDKASYNFRIGQVSTDYIQTSASGVTMLGITPDYKDLFSLKFHQGRYFTASEFFRGANQIIIGYDVAQTLFKKTENPIGKSIKVRGQRLVVIGVLEKEGNDLLNPINFDNVGFIPYNTARKYVNTSSGRSRGRASISVRVAENSSMAELKDQLTTTLRSEHRLSPKEENNFELNTLSILTNLFDSIFGVINFAGGFIGLFAIIVGVFSVANIMFVSVRERTPIIGIKKALGAKRYVIVTEFLIESVVLCLIGGIIGLLFVYLAAIAATNIFEYEIFLSFDNIIVGLSISVASGIIAGIIPAFRAAAMEPVEAIRS